MTAAVFAIWRVTVAVANKKGIDTISIEIDAPDALSAEEDVTAMLYYGDGWNILRVESVEELTPV